MSAAVLLLVLLLSGSSTWAHLLAGWQPDPPYAKQISAFYRTAAFRPIWFEEGLLASKATQLLSVLQQAASEGLDPADYRSEQLQQDCQKPPAVDLAACELRLTAALLHYARDVGYGVEQVGELDPHWHIPQQSLPATELLQQAASADNLGALLSRLTPPHPDYQRLRDALAELRSSADWAGFPDGPLLKPGQRDPRVALLRARLSIASPFATAEPELYDEHLVVEVERFQALHGLEVDGIIGKRTRAALNVSREQRIAQVALNMERWRWLPRRLGEHHILVNIAGFNLTLERPGQSPLRLRIISGRPDRTSPAFHSRITQLVLNPDWTVPRRIAVEDLLPQLQADPTALESKHILVLRSDGDSLVEVDPRDEDWRAFNKNHFPFLLRQSPGPHNALGRIKFMMPNRHAIYIHDTPAKGLFRKSVRTFSSGCIRVENAIELARQVIGGDRAEAQRVLHDGLDNGQTKRLKIDPPVAVYLVYLTAWVDEQGSLHLYDDVYGRDVALLDRFSPH